MQKRRYWFHFLLHSGDLLEDELRLRLAPIGVGPRQARILDALHRMGTASQVDLAEEFNVTAASMSTMTSRLVEAGLITNDPDPQERRSSVLKLTKSGIGVLEAIYAAWREMDRVIEKAIGRDKAKSLAALTLELRNALGGRTPGGEPERTKVTGDQSRQTRQA
jgi:DNA-binding MarR family transcriptional regulator